MKKEIINCKCIDISLEGYGIAKHNDLVIFVKDFLIGEEASVKIIKHAKNYDVGIIDELLIKILCDTNSSVYSLINSKGSFPKEIIS